MDTTDDVVYSWKEYTITGVRGSGPVGSIDIADSAVGGLAPAGSWQGSYSCCTTTLCSDCSIE